ncbi:MAG: hypothetical protein KC547_20615 [Anaerolineae bacterium]|nr:hypothetical protein [Anaerolineae bacterium]
MTLPELSDAEQLLQLKDNLMLAFRQLPPEHQATMTLVLIGNVMEMPKYGGWLREAYQLRFKTDELPEDFRVTRTHLEQLLSHSQEAQERLTDDDLAAISERIHKHFKEDLFWDELTYHVAAILEGKASV